RDDGDDDNAAARNEKSNIKDQSSNCRQSQTESGEHLLKNRNWNKAEKHDHCHSEKKHYHRVGQSPPPLATQLVGPLRLAQKLLEDSCRLVRATGRAEERDPIGWQALDAGGSFLRIAALDDFQHVRELTAIAAGWHLGRVGVQCREERARSLDD